MVDKVGKVDNDGGQGGEGWWIRMADKVDKNGGEGGEGWWIR